MRKPLYGHLENLIKMSSNTEDENPLIEFQYDFLKWQKAVFLSRWFSLNSDAYIEPIGIYTDLNTLFKRIKDEILTDLYKQNTPVELFKTLITPLDGEITLTTPFASQELRCSFIPLNNMGEKYGYTYWKFQ